MMSGCAKELPLVDLQIALQVRSNSHRLPCKALKIIAEKTLLEHAMHHLRQIKAARYLLLTPQCDVELFLPYAQRYGFICFGGSKNNVLQRFIAALRLYPCKTILRATADNPIVPYSSTQKLIQIWQEAQQFDYACWQGLPVGANVELLRTSALLQAENVECSSYQREHVAPFIYQNPHLFLSKKVLASTAWYYPQGRITIDTQEDLEYMRTLFKAFHPQKIFDIEKIIPYLKKHKPSLDGGKI